MKRFVCALVLLCFTVAGAVWCNHKTLTLCNDLIREIESDAPPEAIVQWWDGNGAWLMVLLPHAQIEEIKTAIDSLPTDAEISDEQYRIRRNELQHTVAMMRDSLLFNLQNIF